MAKSHLQKQVSFYLPIDQWRELRTEAAVLGVPITQRCVGLLELGRKIEAAATTPGLKLHHEQAHSN
jgi:hypothetical protein